MKKNKLSVLGMLIFTFLLSISLHAQDEPKPIYLTVTTVYRNLDSDLNEWKKIEQEYYDKVTSKNDLIISSEILTHFFTANSSEILLVSAYKTWEDIDKANDITDDLIKKAWPDEATRKAFFDKQRTFYTTLHSDEIYISVPSIGRKLQKTDPKKPMIAYVRKSQLSLKGGSTKSYKEYNEKVTLKNPFVKGYYAYRHDWGADSRDFIEAFYFDSFGDIEKAFDKDDELTKAAWPKEEDKKTFFDEIKKAFTGQHGDYIYQNEPTMSK